MTNELYEKVKKEVRRLQRISYIDDELEHSQHGIGQGTEYGWDRLRYNAKRLDKEDFLKWLSGVIPLLRHDILEYAPDHEEEKEQFEKYGRKQWKRYLNFLKELRHRLGGNHPSRL